DKAMAEGIDGPLHERPDFVPGYIALITPDGTARPVADGLRLPNGMVVSPDNRPLIIAEASAGALTAVGRAHDRRLSNRRTRPGRWPTGSGSPTAWSSHPTTGR